MLREKITVNLENIVKNISGNNILERILREAIVNSIHAKATLINCHLETKNSSLFDKSEFDNNSIQISKITIEDNGEGFNDSNLISFKEYGTNYKTGEWGAKGTGRFCFFKIADEIVYKSLGQKITLTKKGLIEVTTAFTEKDKTTLELNNIKYKLTTLGESDITKIPNSIKASLLPTFILIKENNFLDRIEINFY